MAHNKIFILIYSAFNKLNLGLKETLTAFLESSGKVMLPKQIQDEIVKHFRALRSSYRDYFPVPDKNQTLSTHMLLKLLA